MHVHRHNSGYAVGRIRPSSKQRHEMATLSALECDGSRMSDGESSYTAGGIDAGFETIDMGGCYRMPITSRIMADMGTTGGASAPRIERRAA